MKSTRNTSIAPSSLAPKYTPTLAMQAAGFGQRIATHYFEIISLKYESPQPLSKRKAARLKQLTAKLEMYKACVDKIRAHEMEKARVLYQAMKEEAVN